MQGNISWNPSPSAIAVAQDLFTVINDTPVYVSLAKGVSSHAIVVNPGDKYDIYVVTYSAAGAQRAVSDHITGTVPAASVPPELLLPATGLAITFTN
jgi:hypothetical protein